MKRIPILALTALILSAIMLQSCRRDEYRMAEGIVWNTAYHVTYMGPETLSDSVLGVLERVEKSVSVFTPGSVVCRVNDNSSARVDSLFVRVYDASARICRESDGYFDPTLAPLIEAYGFAGKQGGIPHTEVTDSIMAFVGMGRTRLLPGLTLEKDDPRVRFNFSAIAKGYGCDAVGAMLRRNGCSDYLVEIGGEICAAGVSPSGDKWHVQVDKPVFSRDSVVHEAQVVIGLSDCSVATSGNYRNYRDDAGRRTGHTFDPHTGLPASNGMLSATVVAPTCMEADAYATACMAMGFDKACEMARRLTLSVLLIADGGRLWMSPGFKKLIVK